MSYPNDDELNGTLADCDGAWCALCLQSLRRDAVGPLAHEGSHVLREREAGMVLPTLGERLVKAWVVPSHQRCHRSNDIEKPPGIVDNLEFYAEDAGKRLIKAAAMVSRSDVIDATTKSYHESSIYLTSVILKKARRGYLEKQGDLEGAQRIQHLEIASAAGVKFWRPRNARQDVYTLTIIPSNQREQIAYGVLFHEALANFYQNHDYRDEAKRHHEFGRQLPLPKGENKEPARVSVALRDAQVLRDKEGIQRALEICERDSYSAQTAAIIGAFMSVLLKERERTSIHCTFETLLHENNSWLYRAEALFGLALLNIASGYADDIAYKQLCAAQYIYSILGLQGIPFHDLDLGGDPLPPTSFPALLLRRESRFRQRPFSQKRRYQLRTAAIVESGLQKNLFDLLSPPLEEIKRPAAPLNLSYLLLPTT